MWSDAHFIWFKTHKFALVESQAMSSDHNSIEILMWTTNIHHCTFTIFDKIFTIFLNLWFLWWHPQKEVFPKVAPFFWIFALRCDSQRLWNDLFSLPCPWLLLQMVLILTNEMSTSHCWSLTRTRQTPITTTDHASLFYTVFLTPPPSNSSRNWNTILMNSGCWPSTSWPWVRLSDSKVQNSSFILHTCPIYRTGGFGGHLCLLYIYLQFAFLFIYLVDTWVT